MPQRTFASLFLCAQLCFVGLPAAPPALAGTIAQQNNEARLTLERGKALLRRGSADQALGVLETALRLFQQANDQKGSAAARDALGDLYNRQGQYGVALDFYQKAYSAFRAENDAYDANLMLAKIGDMQYRQGKNGEALLAYSQMEARKPDTNAFNAYTAARSKVSRARGMFDRMRSIATSTPNTSTAGATTAVAADAAGEVKRSFDLYRQYIIYSIYELGLGRLDFANNQLDSAKTHFQNALAAAGGEVPVIGKLGQTRRFRVASRTSLGDVALRQNRLDEAVKFYTEAASGAQSDNRLELMWPAQRGLGRSRWSMAQQERDEKKAAKLKEEAVAAYRGALKTIETIRSGSLRADDARSTFIATTKDVFDEASGVLAEMALAASAGAQAGNLTGAALEYAAESFQIVEQGRARSLLDLLAESGTTITEGVPADLVRRKQENLDRQQEIAQTLTGVDFAGEAPAKPVAELEAELDRLSVEYDQIENQIRVANPRYGALTATQPATLAAVQQQVLDDKTVLLEYSLGAEKSYLWVVSKQTAALYKLPAREQLDKLAIDLRAQLIPSQLRRQIAGINVIAGGEQQRGLGLAAAQAPDAAAVAYAAAANALYKEIVAPAGAALGDRRLLIVADGALNYVPFEALVTVPAGAAYDALPYLVKTNEVIYAPSASVLTAVRGSADTRTGTEMLLVADPVFEGGDPRTRAVGTNSAASTSDAARGLSLGSAVADLTSAPLDDATPLTSGGLKLARLDGTRVEAQQIAQLAKTSGKTPSVWLDLEASEANVRSREMKQYRLIHIATHGLLNAERPQFSGLVLSLVGGAGGGSSDGFLRTDEIFNLRLGSPLVMLSACETGLGREKRGEGVIGLTRAFMYAGAPTVGVSLWSVADRSTAELMTDFYRRLLASGDAPPAALRAAQQTMIAGKKYSAPFYWAPFVLVGDWR